MEKKIAILLPYKEQFTKKKSSAASIWVNDYLKISKLNDQHAFLDYSNYKKIQIGDLIKFGISHPCITIDKWNFFYMCDEKYNVKEALKTFF